MCHVLYRALRFVMPVLGHVLKHVPRQVLRHVPVRHVLEHMPGHLLKHVPKHCLTGTCLSTCLPGTWLV